MRAFDFSPLFRSTIGFDRLPRLLDNARGFDEAPAYPPYNIEKTGEDAYRLTMAVAGFAESDLAITIKDNALIVTGRQPAAAEGRNYIHRGIAGRAFERRFELADFITVEGAALENGLLHVELRRVIPEAMKPRRVAIAVGAGPQAVPANAPANAIGSDSRAA
ncbi:MAG: Hsp20 family protein [Alphaproteobacteria bacterium]|nr:Hsp20 family protein [Alphaproteobacteria bacterium]